MVHSKEWATGSRLFGLLTLFRHFPGELVVHSTEWTTGSHLFPAFDLVSILFLAFALISALFLEARGLT